ncbi:MAG: dihydroorotase [Candidatus Omnitrophica bacterium]|nr:dihydroorotase [Candidatus Omnitrophota bacterium]
MSLKSRKILIKNGHVVDPSNNINDLRDVLIENSRIAGVAKNISADNCQLLEASGKIVMPGIVDMHVHLREPGREDKETVTTGTQAALKGGVTSLLAMPNTQPAIDCPENVRLLKDIIRQTASVNVLIAAAITKERLGRELTDMLKLRKEGVVALTDDGSSVDNAGLFLQALKNAKKNRLLLISHCEDKALSAGGVVNLGVVSTVMGLKGISRESEYKRVARDISLARKVNTPIHIAHVSCRESVEIIAKAKKQGVKVTAETAPHYFSLSEEEVYGYHTDMKINPPLRSQEDLEAITEALAAGIIDAIASDHAPHTENEKDIEFEYAEFGTTGLETELAASISRLIQTEILDWPGLVRKISLNPAKILGIDKGTISTGKDADIIVVDPEVEWLVSKENFVSRSANSAFVGKKLRGLVEYTIFAGQIAYKRQ